MWNLGRRPPARGRPEWPRLSSFIGEAHEHRKRGPHLRRRGGPGFARPGDRGEPQLAVADSVRRREPLPERLHRHLSPGVHSQENVVVQVVCPACLTANRVPGERLAERPNCGKCHEPLHAGAPVELDDASFDAVVGGTELPVVVDFWAPWCGPCRAMAPHFERAAAALKERVRFAKVNTDEAGGIATRMAIRAIPTLVLFKGGVEAKRFSGVLDARSLAQWIETEGATA